jgi:Cu(I)/Ag(I) efflux system membrane protein CusA/SilA
MRYGENADKVRCSKAKMKVEKDCLKGDLQTSMMSELIKKNNESVKGTLIEEMIAVSIVILLFSIEKCLNILIQLPISVAIGFILLQALGFHLILCLPELL